MTEKEILELIADNVVDFEEEKTASSCREALSLGASPRTVIQAGLAAGMEKVGLLYDKREYFVPELLLCTDAFYAGLEVLLPLLEAQTDKQQKSIVLGVIQGDLHDIGKNLVKVMFEASGWKVHDLGRDVPLEKFVEAQQQTGAPVVGVSALITTSMSAMPQLVRMLKAKDPNVQVILGGAPVDADVARLFGADGYAPDCITAPVVAERLLVNKNNQG